VSSVKVLVVLCLPISAISTFSKDDPHFSHDESGTKEGYKDTSCRNAEMNGGMMLTTYAKMVPAK
jgi:hypothetical protein